MPTPNNLQESPIFLYASAVNVLSPLGASAEFLAAAVKAGVSSYGTCPLPNDAETIVTFSSIPKAALTAKIPAVLPGFSAPQVRLLTIAASCLQNLRLPCDAPLPFLLAGPEIYYPEARLHAPFFNNLMAAVGGNIHPQYSRYFPYGRAGLLYAIDAAFDYFALNPNDAVLIGAVDSFYDAKTLGNLVDELRLLGENSMDGFVPAEGAAFMLLTTQKADDPIIQHTQLKLARPSLAYEPGNILSPKPHPTQALASVVKNTLAGQTQKINKLYSCENGEAYFGRELAVARLRQGHKMHEDLVICRPAEFCGDTGAASVGIALALAQVDLAKSTHHALICASSDAGARGAMCVSVV
ncbi:MAG: hypothetical protein U1F46_10840 [Marinagarivorans sp.]